MDYAIITLAHINSIYSLCIFSRMRVSLLEDGGVATRVNVCMSTCMCICTMLYLIVFQLSELVTYVHLNSPEWLGNSDMIEVRTQ